MKQKNTDMKMQPAWQVELIVLFFLESCGNEIQTLLSMELL